MISLFSEYAKSVGTSITIPWFALTLNACVQPCNGMLIVPFVLYLDVI